MRSKSFLVLAVAALLAVTAAAGSVYWRATSHALPPTPAALFPGLLDRVNEVARVEVATAHGSFTIKKGEGDNWGMVEKDGYPVRYDTVKQAVVGVAGMQPLEAKTAKPELYAKIKVLDPRTDTGAESDKGVLLRFLTADDQEIAAVIVGKTRSLQTATREGWFYVRKPDEARSWLVATRLDAADKAKNWLDIDVPRLERDRLHAVDSRRPDGDPVMVSRPNPDETNFMVDNMPEGKEMIHDTAANSFASALGYISFDDVARAEKIDFSKAVTADYRTFDGLVLTVDVTSVGSKWWARFHAAFDADGVRLDGLSEAAKKKLKSVDEVKAEAEAINKRFGLWAYNIPKFKADDFTTTMSKLVTDKKKPDNS
jgi:Domain of unknown function (DUF4340)